MRKGNKILCPYCNAVSYTLTQFYAHLKSCKERKKWKHKRPVWETDLQGGEKNENDKRKSD